MADGDQKIIGTAVTGEVETTTTSETTLCTYTMANNQSIFLRGHYVAQRIDNKINMQGGTVLAVANAVSGSVTIQGQSAPADLELDPQELSYAVDFDSSSLDVRLRVVGGSQAVQWYGCIEIVSVEMTI